MADLDSILSGESASAPASEPVTHSAPEPSPQREAPEPAQSEGRPEAETHESGEGGGQKMVPHEALHAEKQKVKRYTEQVAEFEKKLSEQNNVWEQRFNRLLETVKPKQPEAEKPQAPDFWEDPDNFISSKLTPVQQQLAQQREQFSQLMAREKYGAEKVDTAFKALASAVQARDPQAQADYQRIMKSTHPYGELVAWHERKSAMAEIGDDPASYRERLKAELLAELQQGTQPPAAEAGQVMPSNLAGARNVGNRSGPAWGGPKTLTDIFDRRSAKG